MISSQEIPSRSNTSSVTGVGGRTDVYRSIIAVAGRTSSKPAFYREAIRSLAQYFGSPYVAVGVQQATSVIEDAWHADSADPGFWKDSVQRFLTDCLADSRARIQQFGSTRADIKVALAACPLVDDKAETIGAVALVVACKDPQEARHCLAEMQGITSLISACANRVGSAAVQGASKPGLAMEQHDALSRAAAYSSKHEMAIAITNRLRNKIGCDQVVLGKVKNRQVKILSISGFDSVSPRSPGAAKIRYAMEECLDRGEAIVFQRADEWAGEDLSAHYRLHKQWSVAAGGDAVATVPLKIDNDTRFVLGLRRQADQPFTRDEIETIRGLVEPLMPGVVLVEQAARPLVVHTKDAVVRFVRAMVRPKTAARRGVVLLAALGVGWFLIGKVQYSVTVPCVVVPDRVQHVSVPFDGTILASNVTAGDKVAPGDVLYELDTNELELERERLLANAAVARIEIDRAVSAKSMVDAKLAHTQVRLFEAQLQIVERKLRQASATAGFRGTVVQGDLRRRIGQVVSQGEPVFEVAPDDGWLLELEVPDVLIGDIDVGQVAEFASQARPEQFRGCRVVRVRPTAEPRRGKNVFVVEAQPDSGLDWLRPGMEGVTRIQIGRRPVRWVVMHRIVNYLRLKLWL